MDNQYGEIVKAISYLLFQPLPPLLHIEAWSDVAFYYTIYLVFLHCFDRYEISCDGYTTQILLSYLDKEWIE